MLIEVSCPASIRRHMVDDLVVWQYQDAMFVVVLRLVRPVDYPHTSGRFTWWKSNGGGL
jgi:hypothetical protein